MRPTTRGQLGGPSPSGTPTHHIRSRFYASTPLTPFLRPVAPPATASRASFCFFDEHGRSRANPTAAVGFPRRGRAAKTTNLEPGRQGTRRQTTNWISYAHGKLELWKPVPSAEAGDFAAHACCRQARAFSAHCPHPPFDHQPRLSLPHVIRTSRCPPSNPIRRWHAY